MKMTRKILKFFKDELTFVIGSFIIAVIPTVFIVIGFMSLTNSMRNGVESIRNYMSSYASSSFNTAGRGASEQDTAGNSNNSPFSGDNTMMNITQEFAANELTSKVNPAESYEPYTIGLVFWMIILLLRFIWWNKPKRLYHLNSDNY